MKSFMSAALQDTKAPSGATECNTCDGGAVRTTGQESAEPAVKEEPAKEPPKVGENAVVIMQGPLGSAITEALNRSMSKKALHSPVQVPSAATESLTTEFVQANGQIKNPEVFLSKISKSVGLVPATDNAPTAINTLIDCASKVDDIEFIMVNKVEADPSPAIVPQKSVVDIMGGERVAIESIQVVVNYRKLK